MSSKIFFYLFLISFFVFSFSSIAFAGSATLTWSANAEPDLAGYKIYYGTSPRSGNCPTGGYPNSLDVGNVLTYTVNNLTEGQIYYFSITAYDNASPRNESSCSAEVNKTIASGAITNLKFTPRIETPTSTSGRSFTITIYNAGSGTPVTNTPFTAQPDGSGNIALPANVSITAGNYDILIKSSNYLNKKMLNKALSSNATIAFDILKAGDINNVPDNKVNSLDWSVMSSVWNTNNVTADINKDGIVNTADFSFISQNLNQVGDN